MRTQQIAEDTQNRPVGMPTEGDEVHAGFAAIVRWIMADCRARLAAEDAALSAPDTNAQDERGTVAGRMGDNRSRPAPLDSG